MILLLLIAVAMPAQALWFQAQHWCVSRVNDSTAGEPANGKLGLLYKEGQSGTPGNPRANVESNFLMINAFLLPGGWTVGDPARMEVPEGVEGYKAGPTPEATPYITTGAGFDDFGSMNLVSSVPVVGGPQLNLTALLQGYYNPGTGTSRRCVMVIEAWQGTAPDALTTLSGTCTMAVDATGNGSNGFMIPGGVDPMVDVIAPGSYYLIVKHKLPNLAAGPNHMPVISLSRTAIPGSLDLTASETVVFKRSDTDTMYNHPMYEETDGKFTLKGGFMDGFDPTTGIGDIGSADFQLLANPTQWERNVVDGADQRADLDGDGFIGSADFQMMAHPLNWETRTSVPYR